MSLFRMDPTYGLCPEMAEGLVSVTDTAFVAATVNRQVLNAVITVSASGSNTGTLAFLGPDNTVKPPRGQQKFYVFCNPNGSAAGAATNTVPLPLGLSTGVTGTLGSEYVIDFSGFPGDITGAQAGIIQNARNVAQTFDAYVSVIDNINKLVYVNIVNASGTLVANNTTNTLVVDVQFCDDAFYA